MKLHLENTAAPNSTRPLVINKTAFGGIFPHKGEKCVRLMPNWRYDSVRWLPVNGRRVVVAKQRTCSERYVPAECLDPKFVETLLPHQVWNGNANGGPFVWKRDFPAEGVRLMKDWRTYACYGPDTDRFTIPAGTVIIAGDGGDAAQAGYHWEA
jgi:hypothetical protein